MIAIEEITDRAALRALRDLAPRDEQDRSARRRHRPTASWKRSDSAGGSRLKRVSHRPTARAGRAPPGRRRHRARAACGPARPRARARTRPPASSGARRGTRREVAPAGGGAQALELACHDHAALIDDDDVLADVLDEVELMAGEQDRRAVAREVRRSPRTGPRRRAGRGRRMARRGRAGPDRARARPRAVPVAGCRATARPAAPRPAPGAQAGPASARRPRRARRRSRPERRARYSSCARTRMCGYRPRSSGM